MRILTPAAIALTLVLAACGPGGNGAGTQVDSAQVILDRHVATIVAADLEGVMADYADNAVVVAPAGIVPGEPNVSGTNVFEGKDNIRKLFAVLTNAENNAAIRTMKQSFQFLGSDTILMPWTQFEGTPQQVSGTDIWVIRDGKVMTQILLVDPPKQ